MGASVQYSTVQCTVQQLLGKERNKFTIAENDKYEKTDGINSVLSYLKSYPLCVNL